MGIAEEFKDPTTYHTAIRKICAPYDEFLDIGARALPQGIRSVCDLGVGSGGFVEKVARERPEINLIGYDMNADSMAIARKNNPSLQIYKGDIFSNDPLPKADFYISSLTLHHLPCKQRYPKLHQIINQGQGLINFDLFLHEGKSKEDLISSVLDFCAPNVSELDLEDIRRDITNNDHPTEIEQDELLFKSLGYNFEILKMHFPFAVYRVSRS